MYVYCSYVERIASVRWELKDLGMEHNGYVEHTPYFLTLFQHTNVVAKTCVTGLNALICFIVMLDGVVIDCR